MFVKGSPALVICRISFYYNISDFVEEGKAMDVLFLDFSKAFFDTASFETDCLTVR